MSKSETSLQLKKLVQGALVQVCQIHFNYIDFVHVTGRLVFNVDNRETTQLTVSEIAQPTTFSDLSSDTTEKLAADCEPACNDACRVGCGQDSPAPLHPHHMQSGDTSAPVETDSSPVLETEAGKCPCPLSQGDMGCGREELPPTEPTQPQGNPPPEKELSEKQTLCLSHTTDKTVETDGPGVPEVKQEEQVLATTDNMDGVTEGNDAGGIGDAGDIGDTGDVSDTNTEIYAVSPKEEDEDTPHTGDTQTPVCTHAEQPADTASTKLYKCNNCNYTTDHKGRFTVHCKRHVTCTQCSEHFYTSAQLRRHVRAVHEKRWACPSCDQVFPAKTHLKRHMRKEHGPVGKLTLFSCQHCKQKFVTRDSLQKHEVDSHVHKCSICGESFTSASVLGRHRDQKHRDAVLTCQKCGRLCSTKGALRKHHARHLERERGHYACDLCGKKFTAQSTLYHHKRGIHSGLQPYHCKICDKRFNFNHSLKLHLLRHKGERPHACTLCDKSYLTASHLKNHVQAVHGNIRKFQCPVCNKSFPYDNSLKMHMMLHTGTKPFMCCICSKGFVSKSALHVHEASHVDGKPHECETCHKHYKTPMLLRAHRRRHTSDGTRFMCDICGNTFMYKSNLEAHYVVHGDSRIYTCKTCNKSFKTYATLYSHQLVHRAEVPFRCNNCGKSFKTKERVRAHEKRHLGLKPFSCTLCGNSFPDKGGLSKHTKTVHAASPRFACPVCAKGCNRMDNLRVHMKVHGDPELLNMQMHELLFKPGDLVGTDGTATAGTGLHKPAQDSPSKDTTNIHVTNPVITPLPCHPNVNTNALTSVGQTLLGHTDIVVPPSEAVPMAPVAAIMSLSAPQYAFYSTSQGVISNEPQEGATNSHMNRLPTTTVDSGYSSGVADQTVTGVDPTQHYYTTSNTGHLVNRIVDSQHLLTLDGSTLPVMMTQQANTSMAEQRPVPFATLLTSPPVCDPGRWPTELMPMAPSLPEPVVSLLPVGQHGSHHLCRDSINYGNRGAALTYQSEDLIEQFQPETHCKK